VMCLVQMWCKTIREILKRRFWIYSLFWWEPT